MPTAYATWAHNAYSFICKWILPAGYICLLLGLALVPSRSAYHQCFYILLAAPTLIALTLRKGELMALLREPVALAFIAFAGWSLLSISWSATDDATGSLIKRPLYVFMLFAACSLLARHSLERLKQSIAVAAVLIIPIALYNLIDFVKNPPRGAFLELIGTGALDNPLLTSHLFGFFCALWISWGITATGRKYLIAIVPLLILSAVIFATGKRTPILAMALTTLWLIIVCWNKRSLYLLSAGLLGLLSLALFFPQALLNRGTSHRLDVWQIALEKASLHPWFGHGFNAPLSISVPNGDFALMEPHNFAIGALYYTGIIGLILWMAMHIMALRHCWLRRKIQAFAISGALLIYGLTAGLTEGGGILARPKEHWFLIWIPLALIAALKIAERSRKEL
ncbi:MAG: O-antigen ligase family protein [Pseudomonas sp.]